MRIRLAFAALAALGAALVPAPPDAEAQYQETYCRIDTTLENRTRRVTGSVMVECGGECPLPPPFTCHTAPFGNWGVDSKYGGRTNRHQFAGWKQEPGFYSHLFQWNSCTDQYYDGPYVNDGRGKQKAAPDNARVVKTRTTWHWTGYRNRNTCKDRLPEVKTERGVTMEIYELDWDVDDHVTDLSYGDIDIRINCSGSWNCSGTSSWYNQKSTDSTGVSAQARVSIVSSFSY